MIAVGNNSRIKAAVMQATFPSGMLDCLNYPAGLLDSAWRQREERTCPLKHRRPREGYRNSDDTTVAAYHLMQGKQGARRGGQCSLGEPSDTAIVPERRQLRTPRSRS